MQKRSDPKATSNLTSPRESVFSTVRAYASRLRDQPGRRVLVVDDDEQVRTFIARVLEDAGYDVITADNGLTGLTAFASEGPFDLILSDVQMPRMSGPTFVDAARAAGCRAPVLFLTGYHEQLFKERTALAEDEAFLNKPCSVKGLLEAVSLRLCGHLLPA